MKDYNTSFISEHTAEFALIAKLIAILKQKYDAVVPIFPWLSREGNSYSHQIHAYDNFKVLGLYPKRPKIGRKDADILLKINHQFVDGANVGISLGIPFLAGCPLTHNIWGLNDQTQYVWVKLSNKVKEYYFFGQNSVSFQTEEELLNEGSILTLVQGAKILSFSDFIDAVRHIKAATRTFSYFGTYRPVYLLIR